MRIVCIGGGPAGLFFSIVMKAARPDADIVVLDPDAPREYAVANSFMNVDYDLYEGETASASVRHTFSRGTLVYDRGKILTEPGHGRFVPRSLTRQAVASR